jgi:hypothetical protein
MNAKPAWIEETPPMNARLRIQYSVEPVAGIVGVRVARPQHAAPAAKPRPAKRLPSADNWAAEVWETLSYAVIWLCGLVAIGFCFW